MKTLDIAVNASRVWHILEACEHHIYCDEQDGEWYVSNKQPLGFFSF